MIELSASMRLRKKVETLCLAAADDDDGVARQNGATSAGEVQGRRRRQAMDDYVAGNVAVGGAEM